MSGHTLSKFFFFFSFLLFFVGGWGGVGWKGTKKSHNVGYTSYIMTEKEGRKIPALLLLIGIKPTKGSCFFWLFRRVQQGKRMLWETAECPLNRKDVKGWARTKETNYSSTDHCLQINYSVPVQSLTALTLSTNIQQMAGAPQPQWVRQRGDISNR